MGVAWESRAGECAEVCRCSRWHGFGLLALLASVCVRSSGHVAHVGGAVSSTSASRKYCNVHMYFFPRRTRTLEAAATEPHISNRFSRKSYLSQAFPPPMRFPAPRTAMNCGYRSGCLLYGARGVLGGIDQYRLEPTGGYHGEALREKGGNLFCFCC